MAKEQQPASRSSAADMCTSDKHNNRQSDGRAPLRTIPAQPTPTSPIAPIMQEGVSLNAPGRQWPSPTKLPENRETPVESFELEDNTTGSGGTSWTLRVPWLRNKRPRRRQDDENSSLHSSIRTVQSQSTGKLAVAVPGGDEQDDVYYGGLMKTTSPTFLSVDAGNIEALEGDGLYRDSSHAPTRVLQQQRQPQRNSKSSGSKQKRRQSSRKGSFKASRRSSPAMDHNLLPQHNPPSQPLPPTTDVAGTNTTGDEPGARREYFLASTPAARRQPKNNNKVFRNRSWISTSSRESEGKRRRKQESEDDSLADFDEAEWTPQDSAYGAAIPVCGWVPKRLRQGIEATLIFLTAFALVYLVVTTSINVSESKGGGSHVSYNDTYANSGVKGYDIEFDDDWYVESSQYQNDEDDYLNYDNKYGGDNNNRGNNNNNQGG